MSTTEPVVPLPGRPSLEQLKNQAREMQRASGSSLTDAQLQLARRHGFASWPKLKAHVETVTALTRTPDQVDPTDPLALVCLTYGTDTPDRWARGSATISAVDAWSAAALCDVDALRAFAADATRQGGPFDWEPLLYLCYSRVSPAPTEAATLAAATFLLDHVANDAAERLAAVNRSFASGIDLATPGDALRVVLEKQGVSLRAMEVGADDSAALPLAPGSIDLAMSLLALQFVNDLPGVLAQVRRALKPDGLLLAAMVGGDTLTELRQAFAAAEAEIEGGVSPHGIAHSASLTPAPPPGPW